MCAVPFKQLVGTVLVAKDLLLEAGPLPLPGSKILTTLWRRPTVLKV